VLIDESMYATELKPRMNLKQLRQCDAVHIAEVSAIVETAAMACSCGPNLVTGRAEEIS
jgi:hypothetical protein